MGQRPTVCARRRHDEDEKGGDERRRSLRASSSARRVRLLVRLFRVRSKRHSPSSRRFQPSDVISSLLSVYLCITCALLSLSVFKMRSLPSSQCCKSFFRLLLAQRLSPSLVLFVLLARSARFRAPLRPILKADITSAHPFLCSETSTAEGRLARDAKKWSRDAM